MTTVRVCATQASDLVHRNELFDSRLDLATQDFEMVFIDDAVDEGSAPPLPPPLPQAPGLAIPPTLELPPSLSARDMRNPLF